MSAVVIDFASILASRKPQRGAAVPGPGNASVSHDFTFWRGATGGRYVHTIYPLLTCPELPACNVMLIRRHPSGRAEIVHIGCVEDAAHSLNLAQVRMTAATLGANEVHVHLLGRSATERAAIEHDIASAGDLAAGATRH